MRFIRNFKLSDWCLQVIVEHLHLYIFNTTVPRKQVDFLLRLYSEVVYRRYSNQNYMSEDCVLWFLNPYNKKITLTTISERIVRQLQDVGPAVSSLTLHQSLATEIMLSSIICCTPHVTYLDLSATACSDRTLLCIKRMCPNLVTLNLSDCDGVTDDGMDILCDGNLSVRNLDLSYSGVKYNGFLSVLKGMPSLQCLKFYNIADSLYFIHEDDFKTSAYENIKYNLTELEYESRELCDDPLKVIWAWTVMCPNVKKVHFKFPVNKNVLEMCTKFEDLEELKIRMSHSYFIPDVLTPILPLANTLKKLILTSANISVVTLVESFKNLETLYLNNVRFTDFKEEDIKTKETKLNALAIKDTNAEFSHATYKSISLLISLSKNVTKLYLNILKSLPCELFRIILNSMKNLTSVDFSYTTITMSSLICFFEIPTLKIVYCDLCKYFSLDDSSIFRKTLAHNSACTLSWRILYDNVDDADFDHDVYSDKGITLFSD